MTTLAPGGKYGLVNSEFKLWEFMSRPEVAAGIAVKLDNVAFTTMIVLSSTVTVAQQAPKNRGYHTC